MFTAKGLFKACGVLFAFATSFWPIYNYSLNEDSIQAEFGDFYSSKERINPAFTVCFDRATFYKFNQTSKNRLGFDMQHQIFSDQPTLDITDFIEVITIKDLSNKKTRLSKAGINVAFDAEIEDIDLSLNTVLRRFQATSCFAIGISSSNKNGISAMDVGIRKDIFKRGAVPTRNQMIHGKGQLKIGLSFGNQYFPLLSRSFAKLRTHDSKNNVCSDLVFKVRGMEIVSRRNSPSKPCNDYGDHDPTKVLKDAAPDLQCMPNGWDKDSILPVCKGNQLNESVREVLVDGLYESNAKSLINPCKSIVDVWYEDWNEVLDSCTDEKDILHITTDYKDLHYKEIKFVRAYTLWNFFEDITFIIGIFLVISWQQLPNMMKISRKNRKNKIRVSDKVKNAEEQIQILIIEIATLKSTVQFQKQVYVTDV